MGENNTLYPPITGARDLKILLLLSEIIPMIPSFACHCFSFFIVFPEDYLEEVFVTENNKGLSVPMDIQEFIKRVGCWLCMAWWVEIESRWGRWSTTTPSMDKSAPFRLNRIMSCNWFDSILSAIFFTNREVPYEDGFFQMSQLEEAWNQNMDQQFFSIMDQCSWWVHDGVVQQVGSYIYVCRP